MMWPGSARLPEDAEGPDPDDLGSPTGRPPRVRPRVAGVAPLALVLLGLLGLAYAWLLWVGVIRDRLDHDQAVSGAVYLAFGVQIAVSSLLLVGAVGVWWGREWGRRAALVGCWVSLGSAVLMLAGGAIFPALIAGFA